MSTKRGSKSEAALPPDDRATDFHGPKSGRVSPFKTTNRYLRGCELRGPIGVQRFQTEAGAASQLGYLGIVPIFAVGEHDGQRFFSMADADGLSLARVVADGTLLIRNAADIVQRIAKAIFFAHQRGAIHRLDNCCSSVLSADRMRWDRESVKSWERATLGEVGLAVIVLFILLSDRVNSLLQKYLFGAHVLQ